MSTRSVGVAELAPAADQVFPIRTVWVAGIATLATAVVGAGLGLTSKPGFLALAGAGGLVFLALALAAPRAAFVAVVFALAGYLPDTLLHSGLISQGLLVAVLAAVLIRRAVRVESLPTPRVLWGFGALVAALVISTLPVADLSPAFSKIVDLAGFTVLVVLTVMLVDSERWLYRAMWAVAGAVGLLALLAVTQRELNLPDVAFGGLATMMRDAGIERSGGPLSSNFFGQVVAATAVLVVYLGLTAHSFVARAAAVVVFFSCALALVDTGSRGAFIAFAVTVFLVGVLRGVRFPVLLAFVLVSLVVANALAPPAVKARVTSLATLATGQIPEDSSFSGRLSENLAALDMWRSHPLIGVGPGNFESEYLSYSPAINLDQRAEVRSAHDLYLESLAETGIVGSVPFFSLLAYALIEAWKGRRGKRDRLSLLSEGAFIALVSFLITAVTLHAGYPRYLWMFVGLALAAGRVRRTSVAT